MHVDVWIYMYIYWVNPIPKLCLPNVDRAALRYVAITPFYLLTLFRLYFHSKK